MTTERRLKRFFWTHFQRGHVIISGDRFYLNWYNNGPWWLSPSLMLLIWRWGPVGPHQIYQHSFGFEIAPFKPEIAASFRGWRVGRFYVSTRWKKRR